MQQFILCFVIALLAVVPVIVLSLHKKSRTKNKTQRSTASGRDEIQRKQKLTSGTA